MFVCAVADKGKDYGEQALVALFRTWHHHCSEGANPLPAMADVAAKHCEVSDLAVNGCGPMAVAGDSFFALTEACLGRALRPGGGDGSPSADERALLATLRHVPVLQAVGPNSALPHGLPGALQWPAFAVLRWLHVGNDNGVELPLLRSCPYPEATVQPDCPSSNELAFTYVDASCM